MELNIENKVNSSDCVNIMDNSGTSCGAELNVGDGSWKWRGGGLIKGSKGRVDVSAAPAIVVVVRESDDTIELGRIELLFWDESS